LEETGLIAQDLVEFPGNYIESEVELKDGLIQFSFQIFLGQNYQGQLLNSTETEPFWLSLEEARKTKLLGLNNQILEAAIKFLGL
jgi:hypothetical protein